MAARQLSHARMCLRFRCRTVAPGLFLSILAICCIGLLCSLAVLELAGLAAAFENGGVQAPSQTNGQYNGRGNE